MAGHSQFKNIMHRKNRQDAAKSRIFSKLVREISVAAKSGILDPDMNPRLRLAVLNARGENMPKDIIERAIKKGSATDMENYEEIRYEGYAPGGVAMIVEALTDNRNRTSGSVRSSLAKFGGALADVGSVSYLFDRVGEISYVASSRSMDDIVEAAINAGANDVTDSGSVICNFEVVNEVAKSLESDLGVPETVKIIWHPKSLVTIGEEHARTLVKLMGILEDNCDVHGIYTNIDITPEIAEKIAK